VRRAGRTTERAYARIVDEAAHAYSETIAVDKRELAAAARKKKGEWRAAVHEVGGAAKEVRRIARRAVARKRR
jgi:hypothetical protein